MDCSTPLELKIALVATALVTMASTCEMDAPAPVPLGREIVNATPYHVRVDLGPGTLTLDIPSGDTLALTGTCDASPNGTCEVGYESPTSLDLYFDSLRIRRERRGETPISDRRLGGQPSANVPGWEFIGDRDGDGRTWVRYVINQEDFDSAEPL